MALKSIKNIKGKISSLAEGENLGTAKADYDPTTEEIQKTNMSKKKKAKRARRPIETEPDKGANIAKDDTNKVITEQVKVDDLVDGYKDIISILGIKEDIDLNLDFSSQDLDYVEFTQTQPLGFDFDEVTDFISRVKYSLYKLESALRQRDSDIKRLASEVKRVEEKMIASNQEKELDRMIGGMTEEERLIEENMDLKVQVNEARRSLAALEKDSEVNADLLRRIEVLQIENDILKSGQEEVPSSLNNSTGTLPPVLNKETIETDDFSSMLEDIGGLYNE